MLIYPRPASKLINWRHSGFSLNNSIRIPALSSKAREALSQYIARPPISLQKITFEETDEGNLISYTSYNDFFKGKLKRFTPLQLIVELTQHILSRGVKYI